MTRFLPRKFTIFLWLVLPFVCHAQEPQRLRPTGPYRIQGVMVDAKTGAPIPEAEIEIQESAQPNTPAFESIESGADGSFQFANLAEGKYSLLAARQGYAAQAYLQHENFWTGVAVGPGKDATHLRFPLSPSAKLIGQVLDETGEALRGAAVQLWKEELDWGRQKIHAAGATITNDEGKYRFEHLAAGRYSVSVSAVPWYSRFGPTTLSPYLRGSGSVISLADNAPSDAPGEDNPGSFRNAVYPTLYYPNSREKEAMGWIAVHGGDLARADLQMEPVPSAHIYVSIGPGQQAPGAPVQLQMELPDKQLMGVQARTTEIAPGTIDVSGIAPGRYQIGNGQEASEDGETSGQSLDVAGSAEVSLTGAPIHGYPVHGTVHFEGVSLGSAYAILQLTDFAGRKYRAGYNPAGDEQAEFSFATLPTGTGEYEISITEPSGAKITSLSAAGAKVSGNRLETDGTGDVKLVIGAVLTAGVLEGVALRDGKPFAGAMVTLLPEKRADWTELARRDQSDSDGTFRLAAVVPGKYKLLALEHGWELEWSQPGVLDKYFAKSTPLEIGERPQLKVNVEVQ